MEPEVARFLAIAIVMGLGTIFPAVAIGLIGSKSGGRAEDSNRDDSRDCFCGSHSHLRASGFPYLKIR